MAPLAPGTGLVDGSPLDLLAETTLMEEPSPPSLNSSDSEKLNFLITNMPTNAFIQNSQIKMMKATKAAIMESENKLRKEWKTGISEAVDPWKDEMADLRTTVEKLQFSSGSCNSQLDKETLNLLNSFDPALRRVTFIGFKVDVLESNRMSHMKRWIDSI
eukprot:4379519-Pyramimonas_sp.AAC.1